MSKTVNPLASVLDRAMIEALGSLQMELVKQRSINAVQAAEIQRLRAELEAAKGSEPELPLAPTEKGSASNGASHH